MGLFIRLCLVAAAGILWLIWYRLPTSLERAFLHTNDQHVPWPWELSGADFRGLVIYPGLIFTVIVLLCFNSFGSRKTPPNSEE